jgi:hypothetical protein
MNKVGTPAAQLYAPAGYWNLTPEEHRFMCDGCGRGILSIVIPDVVFGLRITAACDIHDYMYLVGDTYEDKQAADRVFLNNMLRLVEARTDWDWLKKLRAATCYLYYLAVDKLGGPSFWARKNAPDTEGAARI